MRETLSLKTYVSSPAHLWIIMRRQTAPVPDRCVSMTDEFPISSKMTESILHQFLPKHGDTQTKIFQNIRQAVVTIAWRKIQWSNRFKRGRNSVEREAGSGTTSPKRSEISTRSVRSSYTEDLRKRRVSAQFVPKLLAEWQKQFCMKIVWFSH